MNVLSQLSCGRSRKIIVVTNPTSETGFIGPPGPPGPPGVQGETGPAGIPGTDASAIDSFILLTPINKANSWMSTEGLVIQTQGLRLANPVGAFNGGGTGNKFLTEVNHPILRGKFLNTFDRIEVMARKIRPEASGTLFLYVNMQIKDSPGGSWNGPPLGPDRIVIGNKPGVVGTTFSTITYAASESIWTVAGPAGLGLNPNGDPMNPVNAPLPLTGVPDSAFFFYGFTGDGGFPANTETSPLMFVTSDSGSIANRTLVIQSFTIFFNDATPPIVVSFID